MATLQKSLKESADGLARAEATLAQREQSLKQAEAKLTSASQAGEAWKRELAQAREALKRTQGLLQAQGAAFAKARADLAAAQQALAAAKKGSAPLAAGPQSLDLPTGAPQGTPAQLGFGSELELSLTPAQAKALRAAMARKAWLSVEVELSAKPTAALQLRSAGGAFPAKIRGQSVHFWLEGAGLQALGAGSQVKLTLRADPALPILEVKRVRLHALSDNPVLRARLGK